LPLRGTLKEVVGGFSSFRNGAQQAQTITSKTVFYYGLISNLQPWNFTS